MAPQPPRTDDAFAAEGAENQGLRLGIFAEQLPSNLLFVASARRTTRQAEQKRTQSIAFDAATTADAAVAVVLVSLVAVGLAVSTGGTSLPSTASSDKPLLIQPGKEKRLWG